MATPSFVINAQRKAGKKAKTKPQKSNNRSAAAPKKTARDVLVEELTGLGSGFTTRLPVYELGLQPDPSW